MIYFLVIIIATVFATIFTTQLEMQFYHAPASALVKVDPIRTLPSLCLRVLVLFFSCWTLSQLAIAGILFLVIQGIAILFHSEGIAGLYNLVDQLSSSLNLTTSDFVTLLIVSLVTFALTRLHLQRKPENALI